MANKYERQTLKEQGSEKEIYPNIISDCIPVDAIDTSQIKDNAIITEKIKDGAVTIEKISGTFGGDRITDNSIPTKKIEDGAVTTAKIANGAVDTNQISNGAITNKKLRDTSVGTSKIQDSAITTPKIATGAVTSIKIADEAVGEEKIASNSISTIKIKDGVVTAEKIANGAVTLNKISNITQGSTVATQEYVDEHGGGGSTLYKHFIHLTFLDGCQGEYDVDGWVILETTSNTQYTATTFKALFDSPNLFEDSEAKLMTTLSSQCIKVGWSSLKACCYTYNATGDYFSCEADYSGELTLATITDTVTPV